MADSRWRLGALTSTVTFAKTDAQVADILRWFMVGQIGPDPEGMTPAQLNQWKLDAAHRAALDYIQREAQRNRLNELRAAQGDLDQLAFEDSQL